MNVCISAFSIRPLFIYLIKLVSLGRYQASLAKLSLWCLPFTFMVSVHAGGQTTVIEDFSTINRGSRLDTAPGWTVHYGEVNKSSVMLEAGFRGNGGRISDNAQFKRMIAPLELNGTKTGSFELAFKIRIMADNDAYTVAQITFGQSDGVHGLMIRFNGGEQDGWEDNYIELSDGGQSWSRIHYRAHRDVRWRKEEWHEVRIRGELVKGLDGIHAPTVTILKIGDRADALATKLPIFPVGDVGRFERIDVVVVGNGGAKRVFDFDDLSQKINPR